MALFVDLTHPLGGDVGVDLGGAEIFVPQHLLDAAQIRAGIQQVRGEGVPQFVGREIGRKSRGLQVVFEGPLEGAGGDPFAEPVDEEGRSYSGRAGRCP